MTKVKTLLIVLAVLGLAGAALWQVWLKDQVAFAEMATAYGAKMVCSCRFVAGRDMDSCRRDFTVDISAFTFEEGEAHVRTSVLGGLVSARAQHTPGMGCALTE